MRVRDLARRSRATRRGRRRRSARTSRPSRARARVASPLGVVDLELRDVRRDARDLLRAQARHEVVVVGVVRDVARAVGLLDAADAVLEPRRARHRPRPRERLLRRAGTGGTRRRRSARSRTSSRCRAATSIVGQEPRLGAVREVRVGEEVHRRAVLERDAARLDRRVEAVRRRRAPRRPAPATRRCARTAP